RRWNLLSARIIKIESNGLRLPIFEERHQIAARDVLFCGVDWQARNADAIQCCTQGKIAVTGDKRARYRNLHALALPREGPAADRTTCDTHTDAIVVLQIRRLRRSRTVREIVGRGNDGRSRVIAEAHSDHVLLDAMARPDAGVESV